MSSPRVAVLGRFRESGVRRDVNAGLSSKLLILFAAIAVITFALRAFDSEPSFLFGDSAVYLTTAVGKWIPPDRSFIYGLILRPLAVWPRSLEPVVVAQALVSLVTSWMIGFSLVRYFGTSFFPAAFCAILSAVEPLQLMAQRYILPESLSMFVFACFLLASFSFLKTSSLSQLALIQILGVVLVSLRLTFLAIVIALAVLLPVLSRRALSFWKSLRRTGRMNWMRGLRYVVVPLVFSLAVSQSLLFGYRYFYGDVIGKPPAYLYRDGLFLLADISPIVRPSDYPIASRRDALFASVKYPLADPRDRAQQRWATGGLCDVLVQDAGGNEDLANTRARQTALHAIWRDPLGVAALAATTYGEYFHYTLLRSELLTEQGRNSTLLPREKEMLQNVFGVDASRRGFESLTKKWESHATLWCWFVMAAPLLYSIFILVYRKRVSAAHVVCAVCAVILMIEAVVPVEHPVTRDLMPLAWLTILMIGTTQRADARRGGGRRGVPAIKEPAQNGHGGKRAPQRAAGFFGRLGARIRALCAIEPAAV